MFEKVLETGEAAEVGKTAQNMSTKQWQSSSGDGAETEQTWARCKLSEDKLTYHDQ